jgi:ribosome-binding ATPase YchF (GTP1/OBG family)
MRVSNCSPADPCSSSDFENKFVCGEIMSYEDLKEHGSESAVKAAGKLRQQGKPYESEFNVRQNSSI